MFNTFFSIDNYAAPSIGQRSASQLESRRPQPSMTPRQKSYDDLKRHQVKSRTLPRQRVTRTPQRSAASQRKPFFSDWYWFLVWSFISLFLHLRPLFPLFHYILSSLILPGITFKTWEIHLNFSWDLFEIQNWTTLPHPYHPIFRWINENKIFNDNSFIASSRNTSPKRMVTMPTYKRERSEDFMKTYSVNKTRIPTPSSAWVTSLLFVMASFFFFWVLMPFLNTTICTTETYIHFLHQLVPTQFQKNYKFT